MIVFGLFLLILSHQMLPSVERGSLKKKPFRLIPIAPSTRPATPTSPTLQSIPTSAASNAIPPSNPSLSSSPLPYGLRYLSSEPKIIPTDACFSQDLATGEMENAPSKALIIKFIAETNASHSLKMQEELDAKKKKEEQDKQKAEREHRKLEKKIADFFSEWKDTINNDKQKIQSTYKANTIDESKNKLRSAINADFADYIRQEFGPACFNKIAPKYDLRPNMPGGLNLSNNQDLVIALNAAIDQLWNPDDESECCLKVGHICSLICKIFENSN